jgi:hypothetical protein
MRAVEEPSIKGAAIAAVQEHLALAVERGAITRDAIEARLRPEDLFLLDDKIESSLWYPVESVARANEILIETLGEGSLDYMIESGRDTAARFQREGVFAAFIHDAARRGDKMGPVLVRISELALNFGAWEFEGDSMCDFTVTVRDAARLPEPTRYSILGFIETLAGDLAGAKIRVETTRPEASVVTYRGVSA